MDSEPHQHWTACQGVDRSVVVALWAPQSGVEVPNDYIADYVRQHAEKLIGYASVHPCDPGAVDELERCAAMGLQGLKLSGVYQQFDPPDERAWPVYEWAAAHDWPILWHQASTLISGASMQYASPLRLEPIAMKWPSLKMVLAHLGQPWTADTACLMRKHRSLYADISSCYYRPWQFYQGLVNCADYGVLDRVVFASDFPTSTPEETIAGLRRVNDVVDGTNMPRISEEKIEQIIYAGEALLSR